MTIPLSSNSLGLVELAINQNIAPATTIVKMNRAFREVNDMVSYLNSVVNKYDVSERFRSRVQEMTSLADNLNKKYNSIKPHLQAGVFDVFTGHKGAEGLVDILNSFNNTLIPTLNDLEVDAQLQQSYANPTHNPGSNANQEYEANKKALDSFLTTYSQVGSPASQISGISTRPDKITLKK